MTSQKTCAASCCPSTGRAIIICRAGPRAFRLCTDPFFAFATVPVVHKLHVSIREDRHEHHDRHRFDSPRLPSDIRSDGNRLLGGLASGILGRSEVTQREDPVRLHRGRWQGQQRLGRRRSTRRRRRHLRRRLKHPEQGRRRRFKNAKKFSDYREMLTKMADSIDAVTVSIPDHNHAPASAMAMKLGKHCFTQKPMTHSLYEARQMAVLAKKNKVQTQMGNQGTASSKLREGAAIVQSGVLGQIKEVHVWTNRPVWPQGGPRPKEATPPQHLNWDVWLGPAPKRPYGNGYHPFAWRGWWDFGTGALGDMACHTMNMPFMALNLKDPVSVEATNSGHNKDSFPKSSVITYEFPKLGERNAVKMIWYDGGERPPQKLLPKEQKVPRTGSLLIGDKGMLLSPGDYGQQQQHRYRR